jgi:hypothetical protein
VTPEQRLEAANEINGLWFRHIRDGEEPPDVLRVAGIIEKHVLNPCRSEGTPKSLP